MCTRQIGGRDNQRVPGRLILFPRIVSLLPFARTEVSDYHQIVERAAGDERCVCVMISQQHQQRCFGSDVPEKTGETGAQLWGKAASLILICAVIISLICQGVAGFLGGTVQVLSHLSHLSEAAAKC